MDLPFVLSLRAKYLYRLILILYGAEEMVHGRFSYTDAQRSAAHAFDAMVESMLVSEHAIWWLAEGAGDDWKMEVLGAPPCSDVAMAPTFALGACPQSRPKR